jgi:hypothetical protein
LVEDYLRQDGELSRLLKEGGEAALLAPAAPPLPPDREAQALNRTKRLLHGWDWSLVLLLLAIQFSAQAFARIIADTSWDVSPINFIIMTAIAAGFWCAYVIRRAWVRRKVYRQHKTG